MANITHPLESSPSDSNGGFARIAAQLPSPTMLWFLGLLSLPAILFDQLEFLNGFALFFLFGFWPFVRALLESVWPTEESVNPADWINKDDDRSVIIRANIAMILMMFQPFAAGIGLLQMMGQIPMALRYRWDLPTPETHESSVEYRLPFEGTWTVVNGSPDQRHSHSWGILTQRYAHDFVMTDDAGQTHRGERSGPEAHYCFGEPILAPASGTVVKAQDGHRDYHRTDGLVDPLQRHLVGNHVVIEHADGEYSMLAHLQQGSVSVSENEWVEQGDRIGRCGNSGNSTEPHLHFHIQDRPNFFLGMGLPVRFDDIGIKLPNEEPTYKETGYVHAGQMVASGNMERAERTVESVETRRQ